MLKLLLLTVLEKWVNDIKTDNCNMTELDLRSAIIFVSNIVSPDDRMSKIDSAEYLGVSSSTFDNYVRNGWIPKGEHKKHFHELSWHKLDLDLFKNKQ